MITQRPLKAIRVKQIAVLRALQLGDLLVAIPAIRALKKELPNATITLISLPCAEEFVKRFDHYFDDFIPFPGYPGLPEQKISFDKLISFIHEVRKKQFDLLIQMQGNGSVTNPLIELLGAKKNAGYYRKIDYQPKGLFLEYPEEKNEIEKHMALMHYLGIKHKSTHLEIPVTSQEQKETEKIKKTHRLHNYIGIHPGASNKNKQWNAHHFASVADYFALQGYQIVVTGTTKDKKAADDMQKYMQTKPLSLIGKTSLGMLAEILQSARLVITNDTATSHIASAVKTKSVIIFSPSSQIHRWKPLNTTIHIALSPKDTQNPQFVIDTALLLLNNSKKSETSQSINTKTKHIPITL